MTTSSLARHLSPFVATLAMTAGCLAEPADDGLEPVAEATEELSHVGPLVLQDGPVGAWAYDELARGWLGWAMGVPWSTGPVTDTTGDACADGQHGLVWFLAGTPGGPVTRSCDVPKNKFLYFPLINYWMTPPAEFVDTPAELADFVAFAHDYFPGNRAAVCSLTLRVDGHDLLADTAERDAKLWVDIYDPFPVTLNDDNFAGLPGGDYPAALTAGHYALLKPLSPGHHTVELGGAQCESGQVVFETSAVYDLDVGH